MGPLPCYVLRRQLSDNVSEAQITIRRLMSRSLAKEPTTFRHCNQELNAINKSNNPVFLLAGHLCLLALNLPAYDTDEGWRVRNLNICPPHYHLSLALHRKFINQQGIVHFCSHSELSKSLFYYHLPSSG